MKSIIKYTFLGALTLSMAGCTETFSDINTNHRQVQEKDLEKDNLSTGAFFTQMQNYVVIYKDGTGNESSDYQVAQGLSHDLYSGYIGPTGTWASGSHNGTYKMTWYEQMFTKPFSGLMPAWAKLKEVSKTLNTPEIGALADIVKVEGMHRVTDSYGPIPYINFGSGTMGTAFDKQSEVYKKFFEELDAAIEVLTPYAQAGSILMQDYDNVYDGDVTKWVKFANTLRLRLALRVVYADATLAQTEAEKSIVNPVGVIEAVDEHAELLHSKLNYFHPNFDMSENFGAGEIRMSAIMDSYMNGYKDPRLAAYFKEAKNGGYHGVRLGTGNISSKVAKYAGDPVSKLNIVQNSTPIVWMTAAESYFLRAEGALRGWNMGGSAKEFYEAGVKIAFQEAGVGGADAYLASTKTPAAYTDPTGDGNDMAAPSTITPKWDEDADFETNLERIITQKWIAMYPDGPEGWSEFRRTGYPKLFPVVKNESNGAVDTNVQIRRLPYPQTEYTTNGDAVAAGVSSLNAESNNAKGDNGGTTLWWDKKTH